MSDLSATSDPAQPDDAARRLIDAAAWRRLLSAGDMKLFSEAWLMLLVAQVDLAVGPLLGQRHVVRQGMVALGAPDSRKYARTAWFGAGRELSLLLAKAGERAIQVRHGTVQVGEGPGALCQIAHPILIGDALHGVVALELPSEARAHLDVTMRLAQWGVAWFAHPIGGAPSPAEGLPTHVTERLDVLAAGLATARLAPAAEAVASLLADRLDVDMVALGLYRRQQARPLAVSHGGFASIRNEYLTALIAAMEETVDAGGEGAYPIADNDLAAPHAAHAALTRQHGSSWVRSVAVELPETPGEQLILLAEGREAVPKELEGRLAALATELAPLIALRLTAERGLVAGLTQKTAAALQAWPVWRRAVLVAAPILLLLLALLPMPYRISVDATLETSERRVIAAPFDGYLAEATARPGDRLSAGAPLGRFDDRDLQHQRSDVLERLSGANREINESIGMLDRGKTGVLTARKAQLEAELALVDDQIGRATLRTPFAAIVVAGDKTQSIGAPMRRGDPLYEIAPANVFRVELDVPQEDFADIVTGQDGSLIFSALPYVRYPLRITRLTPIAVAHDGKTLLRAEADLLGGGNFLRLGMKGVARIDAGNARLGWLLTHRIVAWVRLKLWDWMP